MSVTEMLCLNVYILTLKANEQHLTSRQLVQVISMLESKKYKNTKCEI